MYQTIISSGIAFVSPVLLTIAFGLSVGILFYPTILTLTLTPDTSIYSLIQSSSPKLVDISVAINLRSICIKNSNARSVCQSTFDSVTLSSYNITLYASSNVSTNYLDLPQVAQTYQVDYLTRIRYFYIAMTSIIAVLLISHTISLATGNLKSMATIGEFVLKRITKHDRFSQISRIVSKIHMWLVVILNGLGFFAALHLVFNLQVIKATIAEVSLNIIHVKLAGKFQACVWAQLTMFLSILAMRLIFWQVSRIKRVDEVKIDIIQPKV
ncbi:hypothetical protein DASC09_028220 [Saccharomycopsis crataegensis]|uniref:Uncharacterized protein n=1 Tax=Saccharomycopsis crataegensis TaxID=43959 RepID=A0AAV5QLS9_9ASCO|nr:hypothetical protein DASC09_028220 [Saccharomycopsis crataegensis]